MNFYLILLIVVSSNAYNFLGNFSIVGLEKPSEKVFYISQRIKLNWVESYFYCKSNGLRLAKLNNSDLTGIVFEVLQYPEDQNQEFVFDSSNLSERKNSSKCALLKTITNDWIIDVPCTSGAFRFICEADPEIQDDFSAFNIKDASRLMKYLGNYSDDNNETLKSYFMSPSILQLKAAEAVKFCQSLDMSLASPKNQEEFENIASLLIMSSYFWRNLLIEAYRSEKIETTFLSGGESLNFKFFFHNDLNDINKESCLMFATKSIEMSDHSCDKPSQFICERSSLSRKKVKSKDISMFLKPFVNYFHPSSLQSDKKTIYTSQKFLTVSWIEAKQICNAFGMDLFLPNDDLENVILQKQFNEHKDLPKYFHVGASSLGGPEFPIDDIELDLKENTGHDDNTKHCVMLRSKDENFNYVRVNCKTVKASFMCQEITPVKAESININKNRYLLNVVEDNSEPLVKTEAYEDPTITRDQSLCNKERDIFDTEGKYVKTACIVFESTSLEKACVEHSMNLFVVDSKSAELQVLNFATSIFGSWGRSTLWINGRKGKDGKWYVNPSKKPLLEDVEFDIKLIEKLKAEGKISYYPDEKRINSKNRVQRSRRNAALQNSCLVLAAYGPFKVEAFDCNFFMYGMCEYKKEEVVKYDEPETIIPIAEDENVEKNSESCDKIEIWKNDDETNKQLCLFKRRLNNSEAENICKSNNMKLLNLESSDLKSSEFNEISANLLDGSKGIVFIEGKFSIQRIFNGSPSAENFCVCYNPKQAKITSPCSCEKRIWTICEKIVPITTTTTSTTTSTTSSTITPTTTSTTSSTTSTATNIIDDSYDGSNSDYFEIEATSKTVNKTKADVK